MPSAFVAVVPELSLACRVKEKAPGVVGVPEIVLPLSASPAGSEPVVTVHVYPPVPPLAASDWEYGVPTVPFGRDEVVIVTGAGLTVMLSAWVSELELLSVTFTVKAELPGVPGVPLMVPPALRDKPEGSDPAEMDH